MRGVVAFAWVAGFTALALFSSLDGRLCRWLIVGPAAWGVAVSWWKPSRAARDFFLTVGIMAGSYAVIIGAAWAWGGVNPDWSYLRSVGPYLLVGMMAPAACLGVRAVATRRAKWIWLGLFMAAALVVEANNCGWIDYHRLQPGFIWVGWGIWTEKYYIYWLLLLVWACVASFSWRERVDRLVILGLLGLAAVLIFSSGRSIRALVILAGGVAVYFVLGQFAPSRRTLRFGLFLLLVWWGAAPWLFNALDFSRLDPRINERTRIYRATHDLVQQQPWLGHGFGRAPELTHPLLPRRFHQHLPGGHPHNLGLLFWLEYGLAGALWLCGSTWFLLGRVMDVARGTDVWPALGALIVSFVTIVSFSWDVWDYAIILFYAASAGLVLLLFNAAKFPAGRDPA